MPASLAPYPERILLDYVDDAVRARPDATALHFKGTNVSWGTLARESDAFACALHAMGVGPGDRVAVLLPNCPQFFVVEFAAWKVGAILVPLNPIYTEDELVGPMTTATPKVIVTLSTFYDRVKGAQRRVPSVQQVVVTSIKEWLPPLLRVVFTFFLEKRGGHRAALRDGDPMLPALLARYAGQRPPTHRPSIDDDAILLMSGGTTGTPKAVRVHHHALVITGLQFRAWLGDLLPEWEGSYCLPLPLFHTYGATGVQSACIIGRNSIVLIPNPRDLGDLVKTVERTKPSVFCGVPTLYNALLNHPRVASRKADFASMKACVSGAAPLLAETRRRFTEITGARIMEGYAMTESNLASVVWPVYGPEKIGSVGIPITDCAVKIVDVDDPTRELPAGEVGEILLTGPQIMRGYFNPPAEVDQMLHAHADGHTWLHTADLGYLDEDSYLFIVDRKKDLIKMNGMQVWPREIEEVLAKHP
ncbi:MAG: AMP-binding protein, partial [Gemmatimonadota bacterium]